MRCIRLTYALAATLLLSAHAYPQAAPAPPTALRAARMLDVKTGSVIANRSS